MIDTPLSEVDSRKNTSFLSTSNLSIIATWSKCELVNVLVILQPKFLPLNSNKSPVSAYFRNYSSEIESNYDNKVYLN